MPVKCIVSVSSRLAYLLRMFKTYDCENICAACRKVDVVIWDFNVVDSKTIFWNLFMTVATLQ